MFHKRGQSGAKVGHTFCLEYGMAKLCHFSLPKAKPGIH